MKIVVYLQSELFQHLIFLFSSQSLHTIYRFTLTLSLSLCFFSRSTPNPPPPPPPPPTQPPNIPVTLPQYLPLSLVCAFLVTKCGTSGGQYSQPDFLCAMSLWCQSACGIPNTAVGTRGAEIKLSLLRTQSHQWFSLGNPGVCRNKDLHVWPTARKHTIPF